MDKRSNFNVHDGPPTAQGSCGEPRFQNMDTPGQDPHRRQQGQVWAQRSGFRAGVGRSQPSRLPSPSGAQEPEAEPTGPQTQICSPSAASSFILRISEALASQALGNPAGTVPPRDRKPRPGREVLSNAEQPHGAHRPPSPALTSPGQVSHGRDGPCALEPLSYTDRPILSLLTQPCPSQPKPQKTLLPTHPPPTAS